MKFQPLHERVVIRRAGGRYQFEAGIMRSGTEIEADAADFMTLKAACIMAAFAAGEAAQRTA